MTDSTEKKKIELPPEVIAHNRAWDKFTGKSDSSTTNNLPKKSPKCEVCHKPMELVDTNESKFGTLYSWVCRADRKGTITNF